MIRENRVGTNGDGEDLGQQREPLLDLLLPGRVVFPGPGIDTTPEMSPNAAAYDVIERRSIGLQWKVICRIFPAGTAGSIGIAAAKLGGACMFFNILEWEAGSPMHSWAQTGALRDGWNATVVNHGASRFTHCSTDKGEMT